MEQNERASLLWALKRLEGTYNESKHAQQGLASDQDRLVVEHYETLLRLSQRMQFTNPVIKTPSEPFTTLDCVGTEGCKSEGPVVKGRKP